MQKYFSDMTPVNLFLLPMPKILFFFLRTGIYHNFFKKKPLYFEILTGSLNSKNKHFELIKTQVILRKIMGKDINL